MIIIKFNFFNFVFLSTGAGNNYVVSTIERNVKKSDLQ
jgi:hypothetical protein